MEESVRINGGKSLEVTLGARVVGSYDLSLTLDGAVAGQPLSVTVVEGPLARLVLASHAGGAEGEMAAVQGCAGELGRAG